MLTMITDFVFIYMAKSVCGGAYHSFKNRKLLISGLADVLRNLRCVSQPSMGNNSYCVREI